MAELAGFVAGRQDLHRRHVRPGQAGREERLYAAGFQGGLGRRMPGTGRRDASPLRRASASWLGILTEQFRASGAGKGGKPQASTKARGLPLVGDLSVLQARQARQLSSSPARRPGHRNRTDRRCRGRERLASSSHSSAHPVSSSAESPTAAVSQGRIARIARIAKRAAPSLPANAPAKVGSVRAPGGVESVGRAGGGCLGKPAGC